MEKPARGADPQPYDVFLCHRGAGVKGNFCGFLEEALKRAGVRTFVDRSDPLVDAAWATMQDKLETATLVVPVFSSDFVKSSSCLDDLELALRKPANVLPVFYGIWPGIAKLEEELHRCAWQVICSAWY